MPGMQGWFAFENPLLWVTLHWENRLGNIRSPPQMQKMQFTVSQPRLPTCLTQQHLTKAVASHDEDTQQTRAEQNFPAERTPAKGQQLNHTRWGQSEHRPRAGEQGTAGRSHHFPQRGPAPASNARSLTEIGNEEVKVCWFTGDAAVYRTSLRESTNPL